MKKFKFIFILILTGCMSVQCRNHYDSDNDILPDILPEELYMSAGKCLPEVKDKYVYPIRQGYDEKYELNRIPDDVLESLSSYALIQSFLDYPLLDMDYLLSSNASPIGTSYRMYDIHTGILAFEEREDRFEALTSFYKTICFDCVPSLDVEAGMLFAVQISVIEVLFTREKILQSLSGEQKKQAVALLLDKYDLKLQNKYDNIWACITVMAWIMYDDKYPPVMKYYNDAELSAEWFSPSGDMNDIVRFARNYVK